MAMRGENAENAPQLSTLTLLRLAEPLLVSVSPAGVPAVRSRSLLGPATKNCWTRWLSSVVTVANEGIDNCLYTTKIVSIWKTQFFISRRGSITDLFPHILNH